MTVTTNYWVERDEDTWECWIVRRNGEIHITIVDFDAVDILRDYSWCMHGRDGVPYVAAWSKGRRLWMHKMLLGTRTDLMADHINRDPLDNRRRNLRWATPRENSLNSRGWSRCGYKGVSQHLHRWQARIAVHGRIMSLGYFMTPEDAAMEYDTWAREFFGEFAFLNFPLEDAA